MSCFGVIKQNHLVKNPFFGNGQAPDYLSLLPIEHPAAETPRSLTWYLLVVPHMSWDRSSGAKLSVTQFDVFFKSWPTI